MTSATLLTYLIPCAVAPWLLLLAYWINEEILK